MWKSLAARVALSLAAVAVLGAAVGPAHADDVTQSRRVGAFQTVRLEGAAKVVIRVGPAASVSVTADEAIASRVTTEVKDGALVIGMQKGAPVRKGNVRVQVTTPTLTGVALVGVGSIGAQGISADLFQVHLSGAGKLQADGSVKQVQVTVSGAGETALDRLKAHDADVRLSGTGKVLVHATDSLRAQVSGVGEVRYEGKPAQVVSKVSGVGKVRAR